jgi:hypothetical protein
MPPLGLKIHTIELSENQGLDNVFKVVLSSLNW